VTYRTQNNMIQQARSYHIYYRQQPHNKYIHKMHHIKSNEKYCTSYYRLRINFE